MKRFLQARLYSLAVPLMLLPWPIAGFSAGQVDDYLKGDEFRTFLGETLIQILTGFTDAILATLTAFILGLFGGA